MKKFILLNASVLLLFIMSGCVPAGDPVTETYNASIDDTTTIDLDLSSSILVIRVEDREDVYIDYYTYENGPELRVREGNTLRISEERDWPFNINFNQSSELILYLPEHYDESLTVNTSSGDVTAEDLYLKNVEMHLSSGEIDLYDSDIEDLVLTLSSGDLRLESVSSDYITIKSSSGDAELIDVTGEITGRSSSGRVSVEMDSIHDDFNYNLSSGSFRMKLRIPPDNVDFNLGCSSGDVDLDFRLDDYDQDKDNKVKGRIGNGSIDIDVHTSSGDIEIY